MRGRVVLLIFSLLTLLSCEDTSICVTPAAVVLNCDEQKVVFNASNKFNQIIIWQYYTDSSIFTKEVDDNWNLTMAGDWFVLKSTLGSSNLIELEVDANNGDTRQLIFSVDRKASSGVAVVTQLGPTSEIR